MASMHVTCTANTRMLCMPCSSPAPLSVHWSRTTRCIARLYLQASCERQWKLLVRCDPAAAAAAHKVSNLAPHPLPSALCTEFFAAHPPQITLQAIAS